MKLPKSTDDVAVAAWVDGVLDQLESLEAMDAAQYRNNNPGIRLREILGRIERNAIDAGLQGNFRPLVDIRRRANPLFEHAPNWRMSAEAENLVDVRLLGEDEAKRGRPKRTEESPRTILLQLVHEEMELIQRLLEHHYPDQKGHRDRAITIATKRAGIQRTILVYYLGNP